ncbi:MAG TPA: NADH-quinone oxidoreductase subunit M [Elusimicrobiota bacterium]|jgi:NADH-quinone oxidoreductase subunit M|nr:NADH-quinone oxidoreductase subunit M [Elusimicrobiota bacterium]
MALTLLWTVPMAAGLAVWLLAPRRARRAALGLSLAILAYAVWLALPFSRGEGNLRLAELPGPLSEGLIHYFFAVDSLSLSLIWLTALLHPLCVLAAWSEDRPSAYWASFFFLEGGLFGVFTAQNLFYFYAFWDFVLIPMFFIIGLWGSENRRAAAVKFLLYTFLGSMALLAGLVALPVLHHRMTGIWTWDVPGLIATPVGATPAGRWIFAALALGFAVKIPLWPLHNWLPDAHTEAPAGGSVMLAGVMLKMGVYGFLRVILPLFPEISRAAFPIFGALGVINILYGALCAMAQTDLKRLIAFTSISHLGFCVAGLFTLTPEGLTGSALQLINHGISTGGLFLLVGMLYSRAHTRRLDAFGELAGRAPRLAVFFAVILLSSIGLPGLNGFVGELLTLAGLARVRLGLAALGACGTVLAAAYGIPTYQRVFFGPCAAGSVSERVSDLDWRESLALAVLCAFALGLGLFPGPLLRFLTPAVALW